MKILLLDIETAPNLAYVWGLWDQNIAINQIANAGYTLCWAAKWLKEKDIMFDSVDRSGARKMLKGIHKLLDEADVVVHYNGKKFDIPTLNKEFIQNGMNPPSPYKQVDLLLIARRQFKFASNKLDYVSQALNIGNKVRHKGHELWVKCMAGEAESWRVMEKYNKQDVALLEKLHDKMLPWIPHYPNRTLHEDSPESCPSCGSKNYRRNGTRSTKTRTYPRYNCKSCGSWFTGIGSIRVAPEARPVFTTI